MPKKAKPKQSGGWENLPLRISTESMIEVKDNARKMGLSNQATIRLAIERGLPVLLKALGKGGK